MAGLAIPLSDWASHKLAQLAQQTGSQAIAQLDGQTLLGERASLAGFTISGTVSAGGGCRLYPSTIGHVALNLSREDDRELLPALFCCEPFDILDDGAIADRIASSDALSLVARGRSMGMAIAADNEHPAECLNPCKIIAEGQQSVPPRDRPVVVDLSSLWAGPLATHLLWLAGADVIKVESLKRPDSMRWGDEQLFALLNQGKASVALDFTSPYGIQSLMSLIASADIIIEASRPRALRQLGIDANHIVRSQPDKYWITITGHGAQYEAADWVGFGDDTAVAGGLTAAMREVTGLTAFVGDAIGDPLTGIYAACTAWDAWSTGKFGRYGLAMSQIVTHALNQCRMNDALALSSTLEAWANAIGQNCPAVAHRPLTSPLSSFGQDTEDCLKALPSC